MGNTCSCNIRKLSSEQSLAQSITTITSQQSEFELVNRNGEYKGLLKNLIMRFQLECTSHTLDAINESMINQGNKLVTGCQYSSQGLTLISLFRRELSSYFELIPEVSKISDAAEIIKSEIIQVQNILTSKLGLEILILLRTIQRVSFSQLYIWWDDEYFRSRNEFLLCHFNINNEQVSNIEKTDGSIRSAIIKQIRLTKQCMDLIIEPTQKKCYEIQIQSVGSTKRMQKASFREVNKQILSPNFPHSDQNEKKHVKPKNIYSELKKAFIMQQMGDKSLNQQFNSLSATFERQTSLLVEEERNEISNSISKRCTPYLIKPNLMIKYS